ncbi:MAG: hypothetical protein QXK06_05630 [Candidatus Diapherotrites archaeon]
MTDLAERERQLREHLSLIDKQIARFEYLKSVLQAKMDAIREEITKHSFSPTPISLKPDPSFEGDVYTEIQKHLLELNKMKNYLSIKLKEVIQEEELLASLQGKFGKNITFEKPQHGEFEIVFSDEKIKEALDELNKGKSAIKMVRESLAELKGKEA